MDNARSRLKKRSLLTFSSPIHDSHLAARVPRSRPSICGRNLHDVIIVWAWMLDLAIPMHWQ